MNKTTILTCLLYCLVWTSTNTNAQASIPSYSLDSNFFVIANFELLELIDYSQQQSIDDIAQNLHKTKTRTSNFEYASQDANHWLVFSLENTDNVAVAPILRFTEAYSEVVNLYYKDSGN